MQLDESFVRGGGLAGLLIIVLLGVLLLQKAPAIGRALVPYVGQRPAKWALYFAWFAYTYSTLAAVSNILFSYTEAGPRDPMSNVLAFAVGVVVRGLIPFLAATVQILQLGALITAAILLYRHGANTHRG